MVKWTHLSRSAGGSLADVAEEVESEDEDDEQMDMIEVWPDSSDDEDKIR